MDDLLKKLREQALYKEALSLLSPAEAAIANAYAVEMLSSFEFIMKSLHESMAHTGSVPLVMTDPVVSGSIG